MRVRPIEWQTLSTSPAWLDDLRRDYIASLPSKLARIEEALALTQEDPAPEHATASLRLLLHRLHGTAGSYGLHDIGKAAADWGHALGVESTLPPPIVTGFQKRLREAVAAAS